MKRWYIDFAGSCEVEAESEDEAKQAFWFLVYQNEPLPFNLYEIQGVEEAQP